MNTSQHAICNLQSAYHIQVAGRRESHVCMLPIYPVPYQPALSLKLCTQPRYRLAAVRDVFGCVVPIAGCLEVADWWQEEERRHPQPALEAGDPSQLPPGGSTRSPDLTLLH